MDNETLLELSIELVRLIDAQEQLRIQLITARADVQNFASSVFKLCVKGSPTGVQFLKDKDKLTNAISDESYCDSVYPVISEGTLTFHAYNGDPLIKISL